MSLWQFEAPLSAGSLAAAVPPAQRVIDATGRWLPHLMAACAFLVLVETVRLSLAWQDPSPRAFADFDAFYLAGLLSWQGDVERTYQIATLTRAQEAVFGAPRFLPWTYPPPFNLVIAPFALLPYGLAYGAFTGLTLLAYLVALRRIAGDGFGFVLAAVFPAACVTILCGQNGFLMGALVGLTCLAFQNRGQAGLPLGLMLIKPHLAAAFFIFTLASRRWGFLLVASATAVVSFLLATVALGAEVWPAFLSGVAEARGFLVTDQYPVFRMISLYAAARSFGFSVASALVAQGVLALIAIALVVRVAGQGAPLRRSLGLTTLVSLLLSPYAYDYDLPILGIGLALLMPDLRLSARAGEMLALIALSFVAGISGLVQTYLRFKAPAESLQGTGDNMVVSFGGPALLALVALVLWILRRGQRTLAETRFEPDGGVVPAG